MYHIILGSENGFLHKLVLFPFFLTTSITTNYIGTTAQHNPAESISKKGGNRSATVLGREKGNPEI